MSACECSDWLWFAAGAVAASLVVVAVNAWAWWRGSPVVVVNSPDEAIEAVCRGSAETIDAREAWREIV